MSGGAGGSGQASKGVSGSDLWTQRGGRKGEQMWRGDREQRANGNRGVSGGAGGSGRASGQVSECSGWMWRVKRKDDQMWRRKWEWTGEWKWRDGQKWLGDGRCKWE